MPRAICGANHASGLVADSGVGVEPDLYFRRGAVAIKLAKSFAEKGTEMALRL